MGLFSKKKKGEMELPPLPPQMDAPEETPEPEFDLPELPPLPKDMPEKVSEVPPMEGEPFAGLPDLPPLPKEPLPPKPEFKIKAPAEKHFIPKKRHVQPLFVSVDDYKFILDGIDAIKKRISDSQGVMDRLEDLKGDEEKLLEEWKNKITDIEKKLDYVDKAVIKSED